METPPGGRRRSTPTRVRGLSPAALVRRKTEILLSPATAASVSVSATFSPTADPRLAFRCVSSFEADLKVVLPVKSYIWASEKSGDITIRNPDSGSVEGIISMKDDHCWSMLCFQGRVWTGHSKGLLRVWDADAIAKLLRSPQGQNAGPLECNEFLLHEFRENAGGIYCVVSHGTRIFVGSNDFMIRQYDPEKLEFVKMFAGHTNQVRCLTAAQKYIISGSDDYTIRIWSVESGNCVGTLIGHTGGVLAICAIGSKLWSADDTGSLKVWDLLKNEVVQELKGHSSRVSTITQAGKYVWTGSTDRKICIWDSHNCQLVHTLTDHLGYISDIRLMNQFTSQTVWSVGNDKVTRMWKQELYFPLNSDMSQTNTTDDSSSLDVIELRNEIQILKEQMAQERCDFSDLISQLEGSNNTIRQENLDLKEVNNGLIEVVDQRDRLIKELSEKNKDQHDLTIRLQDELGVERQKCNHLRATLEHSESDYAESLEKLQKDLSESKSTEGKLSNELDTLRLAYQNENQKVSDLQIRLEIAQRTSNEFSEIAMKEKTVHASFIQQLEEQLKRIESKLKDEEMKSQELYRKNSVLENLLKTEKEQNSQLRQDYETLNTVLNERLISSTESLSKELIELRSKYDELRIQFEDTLQAHKQEKDGFERSALTLQDELAHMTQIANTAESENETLLKQLHEVQFVLKSRGEFLRAIWQLSCDSDKIKSVIQDISTNSDVRALLRVKRDALPELQSARDLLETIRGTFRVVISNYFTEYEKLHLGISVYHYDPARLSEKDTPKKGAQELNTSTTGINSSSKAEGRSSSRSIKPAWS